MLKKKIMFDYVCSEDDLMVNKEIFDRENSKKFNISLKGSLKRNIAYWQNTLMANESVLHVIENGHKITFFWEAGKNFIFLTRSPRLKM